MWRGSGQAAIAAGEGAVEGAHHRIQRGSVLASVDVQVDQSARGCGQQEEIDVGGDVVREGQGLTLENVEHEHAEEHDPDAEIATI